MYRYLASPRWIAAHLLVLTVVSAFSSLGLWQLDRLRERRDQIAVIESQGRRPPADLVELMPSPSVSREVAESHVYRRATVRGTFDPSQEVLLEGRSNLGRPGMHVMTPLKTSDGSAIIVDRGWVPMMFNEPPVREAAPPRGEVTLTGVLLLPPPPPRLGPDDPRPGRVLRMPRLDLERLGKQMSFRLYPLFLQLEKQNPPNRGALPVPAPIPKPDEGPHLSYAVQWFSFAGLAAITYVAYLRRHAAGSRASG